MSTDQGISTAVMENESSVSSQSCGIISNDSNGDGMGNCSDGSEYAYLYEHLRVYFLMWYLPVVLVVGLLGTAFCLAFLFMSKLFPRSVLLWLVSICIGDFMILVWDGVRMTLKVWIHYDIRDQGTGICKIHLFLSNYFLYWSAYMQAGMSIQRLYLIVRPLQARAVLKFHRLFVAWLGCTLVLTLPHIPYLIFWNIRDNDCDPSDTWYFYITTLSDLILWGIVPMASMTFATAMISWRVIRFQSHFNEKPKTRSLRTMSKGEILGRNTLALTSNATSSCGQGRCGQRHGGSDNASHVTKLLISMNIWYMLTTYPLLIYFMHLNFGLKNQVGVTIPKQVHRFCYYLLRALCYLNSCSNWIFYCAAGRVFRKRAKRIVYRLLGCWKIPEPSRRATVTSPIRLIVQRDDSSIGREHLIAEKYFQRRLVPEEEDTL